MIVGVFTSLKQLAKIPAFLTVEKHVRVEILRFEQSFAVWCNYENIT